MPDPRSLRLLAAVTCLLVSSLTPAFAATFSQTDLVSNVPGLAATTDPNLVNPWGMSFSATSPFWISDQGTNTAILTDGAGHLSTTVVSIPTTSGGPQGPTGQVAAPAGSGFLVGGVAAHFIFDDLNGTISAWASGATATVEATTPGAVYTGLAVATSGGASYLYAANTTTGQINVFNSSYAPVTLAGSFTDPSLPAGYVAYNVQLIGSSLYVTYAELGAHGAPVPGSTGYVDVFNTDGTFVGRVAGGGPLDAPWGITLAPTGFGTYGGDLLVGNFGNGEIDAYSTGGTFLGTLDGANGLPLVNSGLWALDFRTGGTNNNPDALYFTAGIDGQTDGLFGDIVETPEPSTFILAGMGFFTLALLRLRPQQA